MMAKKQGRLKLLFTVIYSTAIARREPAGRRPPGEGSAFSGSVSPPLILC